MSDDQRLKDAAQAVATVQNVPFPGKRQEAIAAAVLAVVDKPAVISDSDEAITLPAGSLIITEQGGYWLHEGETYKASVHDLTFPAQLVSRGFA